MPTEKKEEQSLKTYSLTRYFRSDTAKCEGFSIITVNVYFMFRLWKFCVPKILFHNFARNFTASRCLKGRHLLARKVSARRAFAVAVSNCEYSSLSGVFTCSRACLSALKFKRHNLHSLEKRRLSAY